MFGQRKCERCEELLAELRQARRHVYNDTRSLDRIVLEQWIRAHIKEGLVCTQFKKEDKQVLMAYIDLLTEQLKKHSQTEEEIVEEQLNHGAS